MKTQRKAKTQSRRTKTISHEAQRKANSKERRTVAGNATAHKIQIEQNQNENKKGKGDNTLA